MAYALLKKQPIIICLFPAAAATGTIVEFDKSVAKLIKAPFFFVAVGSQANIGGAASAPIVASAFSPSLAPVGVLMAVLGYALGTYGALICAQLMALVSGAG